MHYNCMIVDDEKELAETTQEYFQMFGVSCGCVSDSASCLTFLQEHEVDIILLDINLKEESGFQLCKKIRETWDMPILFISARQSDDDILIALNVGGDDYIKKPYALSVILAKVKVMLKRMVPGESGSVEIDLGKEDISSKELVLDIVVDPDTRKVKVETREASLKAKEFKLFQYLYQHANKIVTKDELFHAVWGDTFFSDGTLNVHIRKLREKLEANPNEPKIIRTIWGTGYILETKKTEE